MSAATLNYLTSVKLTEEETLVSLPVETGDERVVAAGEICARLIWPLEHEVAGVESVLFKPNSLEVRVNGELSRATVEAEVFRVLSWVIGSANITRAPESIEGFYVGSEWWYQVGDTIYIEGPDGLTEELPAYD